MDTAVRDDLVAMQGAHDIQAVDLASSARPPGPCSLPRISLSGMRLSS